jgi:hypothetical protein
MINSANNFFALFVKSFIKIPTTLVGIYFTMRKVILNNAIPVPLFLNF